MTSPILAAGSMGLNLGGSILSGLGKQAEYGAQAGMYSYQAGVADINRKIALQNRDWTLQTGENEAARYGVGAAQRAGSIKAQQGASGIDLGSGTPADVRKSQAAAATIDLYTIRENALRRAYGFEVDAAKSEAQAGAYNAAATNAKSAGNTALMASLISGAGSVASKWYDATRVGIFGSKSTDNFQTDANGNPIG